MEDAVYEANTGALVRVLIGQLDMYLPESTLEGCCMVSGHSCTSKNQLTVLGTLESNVELLPVWCQPRRGTLRIEIMSERTLLYR